MAEGNCSGSGSGSIGGLGSGASGVVVACSTAAAGVELAVSMFFSPLTMDGPLGTSVSPDPVVPAASSFGDCRAEDGAGEQAIQLRAGVAARSVLILHA